MDTARFSKFDITIIGAGPTGTILSYELAKRGIKVLVLEKEILPRDKVCAGGITVRASKLIPFDFSPVVEDVIYGSRLSYNLIVKSIKTYPEPLAYLVSRKNFDYFLVQKARQAGVVVVDGIRVRNIEPQSQAVKVTLDDDIFFTPLLVGADGANSIVVHSLRIRHNFEYGFCVNSLIPAGDDIIADWSGLMGLDWGIPGGYAWVFPRKNLLSVGAGSSFKTARRLQPYTQSLITAYRLNHGPTQIRGHLMPLRRAGKAISFKRIVLVGDAAGMIDPLSGEGIFYGLKSTYLALETLTSFLNDKVADLKGYEDAVNHDIMPELRIAHKVQKLNSLTPRIFFSLLTGRERVWRAFCRMLRGEISYSSLPKALPQPWRFIFNRI
jgi:geranylgeranyl reductase family protein